MRAFDPQGMNAARSMLPHVDFAEDPYSCAGMADALVIITEWDMFRALDLERLRSVMRSPVVVDLRNIYRPGNMHELGFSYTSLGQTSPENFNATQRQNAAGTQSRTGECTTGLVQRA